MRAIAAFRADHGVGPVTVPVATCVAAGRGLAAGFAEAAEAAGEALAGALGVAAARWTVDAEAG
jgi:hypothetical protein